MELKLEPFSRSGAAAAFDESCHGGRGVRPEKAAAASIPQGVVYLGIIHILYAVQICSSIKRGRYILQPKNLCEAYAVILLSNTS